jgi:hypothetical protein
MEIQQIVKVEAVYWSWGMGGHRIITDGLGIAVPKSVPAHIPNQANFWMPFLMVPAISKPTELMENFSGWKLETVGGIEMVSFYLKKLEGNCCTLSDEDIRRLYMTARALEFEGTLIMSELLLHDKDMKVVAQYAIQPVAIYNGSGLHSLSMEIGTE